ncbi:MAG TPA: carbon starvation CstA family protein [Candidatus Baltobacteraceae bacterium]|jgi:carbon starvation protein|nr:carbon starvation CstA family protein [Candidatus Baltobacteraceae bacterium]
MMSAPKKIFAHLAWVLIASLGAWAYLTMALRRGQSINSAYILVAALCTYAIGYRFYSKWIAVRVLMLDNRRATPCEIHDDGRDFVKTNKWIVFGHHFAAISGPGPLVGPVLAAQFGYLPGALWILIGVVLGGGVQDFVILFCSLRRDGRSLGQMVKDELNSGAGFIALLAILAILVILLAVLALVVVNALSESSWGVFTVSATIPIALVMGAYLRIWRSGKVFETSAIGVILLLLAVWGGQMVYRHAGLAEKFTFKSEPLAWAIIVYGFVASVLPIWLLLAPRDYLSTFVKLGAIALLALGIFLVLPAIRMPALTPFGSSGDGPVFAGKLFPFCFITIACGAISGFHSLISSGTTPKILSREGYARTIGYGAMCLESLVAIMALIAACTLEPGVYFSINMKGIPAETAAKVTSLRYPVTVAQMDGMAASIGEKTLFGRVGGAPTLAVGMAQVFSKVFGGAGLDLWYHFAIMFEALFILTTLDAGTRVGRYLLQDLLGHLWKPFGRTAGTGSAWLASVLIVGAWGWFLIQGVRDPLGGINSLWPLFGIANQLLASIALCLATTVILKMQLRENGRPIFACITLAPLLWLLAVTMTAGVEKIFHSNPKIGFLAAATAFSANPALRFNALLDAAVTGLLLLMILSIVVLSFREWLLLLARRKLSRLTETAPVWLPGYAVAEACPPGSLSLLMLALMLIKELSGENAIQRARETQPTVTADAAYLQVAQKRFDGIHRCC